VKIKQHLQERHLNLELHRPILDEELNIATFLLYNLSGQLVGYQQYNPSGDKKIFNSKLEGKYYTYRNKNQPTIAIWGLESYYLSSGPIFLTEGIFDACRMTNVGQSAFATLANNPPKDYRNWLMMLNRPIVVVYDNDAAGRKLAKFGDYVEVVPEGKDLGESSDDYVQYLINKYK
jgi:DNA primase